MKVQSPFIQFISISLLVLCLAIANIHSSSALELSAESTANISHSQPSVRLTLSAPCEFAPPPTITDKLPDDIKEPTDDGANCFAWQSFIALNWPASPTQKGQPDTSKVAQDFGKPDDIFPTVWQTYKLADSVFLPGAVKPSDWNTDDLIPEKAKPTLRKIQLAGTPQPKYMPVLTMVSEVDSPLPGEEVIPDTMQATGNILVDQASNIIRYEKRINKTEFDYIVKKELYNAKKQAELVKTEGIILPPGSIEIKSAWRVLEGQPKEIQNRYKKVKALLYDPSQKTYSKPTLVGLVGLHIIRKTKNMTGFLWSTFEQVDNVNDEDSSHDKSLPYSFYNPNCSVEICPLNKKPEKNDPPYHPAQVSRVLQIPPNIENLNQYVQQTIKNKNPDSVWQYYKLVNVKWPKNSIPDPAGKNVTIGDLKNGINKLQYSSSNKGQATSNTTMETYVQTKDCLVCHQNTPIAANELSKCIPPTKVQDKDHPGQYIENPERLKYPASDFSFLLEKADTPEHYAANNCKKALQLLRKNFIRQLTVSLKSEL